MHSLTISLLLLLHLALAQPAPKSRFHLSSLKAAYYTASKPIPEILHGPLTKHATPFKSPPGSHPRIVTSRATWDALVQRYASTIHNNASWAASHAKLTIPNGPNSTLVQTLADMEIAGATSVFTGASPTDLNTAAFAEYQRSLHPLSKYVEKTTEASSHAFFLCAFWAAVSDAGDNFLGSDISAKCRHATVAWAKILLAHRTVHCTPTCRREEHDARRAYLWDTERTWEVSNDWYTAGLSLALAYDVMHNDMQEADRSVVRSAIAMLVMKRWTWGVTENSTRKSPNAMIHPHRISGNWGLYHSNLYLANLAIEGESGFVPYAEEMLRVHNSTGFNQGLHDRFSAMIDAFFVHTINPDGSTFEDGYTYHIALREGSLGLLARHLRGGDILSSPRFRNMIHNVAQMTEPWTCAPLVGHASGGGLHYPAYIGLLRFAYPEGPLTRMVWAQRFGKEFRNDEHCRIYWTQSMTQLTFFGDDHEGEVADSPESFPERLKPMLPLAYVSARRGLIVTRASYSQKTSYMHLDARPDSFFLGHDNADRGVITFSALKRRWFDDLPWIDNVDSRKHSLMHVDGLAQDGKAPSVTIMKVVDNERVSIASADLSYAYNVQWAKAWQGPRIGTSLVTEYDANGREYKKEYSFPEAEEHSPWDLGWPMEDGAEEIGFYRSMTLNGHANLAFAGLNEWKRPYRKRLLAHMIRNTVIVRDAQNEVGFGMVVDCAGSQSGNHVFESYLILEAQVAVAAEESQCEANRCKIVIKSSEGEQLDVHVRTMGNNLSFRVEKFGKGNRRLIVKSDGVGNEEFWMAFHPHEGNSNGFDMQRRSDGSLRFVYEGKERLFGLDDDKTVIELEADATPMEDSKPTNNDVTNSDEQDDSRPSNELKLPVQPLRLEVQQWQQVEFERLNGYKATFFHTSGARWQMAFNFTSQRDGSQADMLSTCRSFTTALTSIAIFDCGQGEHGYSNYFKRRCELVAQSGTEDKCRGPKGSDKTEYVAMLDRKKNYYAIVSVFGKEENRPTLMIGHVLAWTG